MKKEKYDGTYPLCTQCGTVLEGEPVVSRIFTKEERALLIDLVEQKRLRACHKSLYLIMDNIVRILKES